MVVRLSNKFWFAGELNKAKDWDLKECRVMDNWFTIDIIGIGGREIEVQYTPGHSPGLLIIETGRVMRNRGQDGGSRYYSGESKI